ncbi:MAG: polysaccharide export protein, partial [Rhizobiales bacterium]|nr:polysaccharide export protein [Hyphomicrobiales bacterium]
MSGSRAIALCLLSAVALSGCMHRPGPVASGHPAGSLDRMAYGGVQPAPAYAARPGATASSGGAIAAVRNSFASTAYPRYAAA